MLRTINWYPEHVNGHPIHSKATFMGYTIRAQVGHDEAPSIHGGKSLAHGVNGSSLSTWSTGVSIKMSSLFVHGVDMYHEPPRLT